MSIYYDDNYDIELTGDEIDISSISSIETTSTVQPSKTYKLYKGDVNDIVSKVYNKKDKCWEFDILEPYAVQITFKKNGYANSVVKLGYDSNNVDVFMVKTTTTTTTTTTTDTPPLFIIPATVDVY